jgi:PHP family Zn ribbon phosphoesterase
MKIIADFHIHSRYSRATSREMEVRTLGRYAGVYGKISIYDSKEQTSSGSPQSAKRQKELF